MTSEERLRELEDRYDGYTVYDNRGEKIGKVDDLFIDESDNEEYIGVKMGLLGRRSTLIPTDLVRVSEADGRIEVADSKDNVKNAPSFDDDEDITPEYEARIRDYFGLETPEPTGRRGAYDAHAGERTEEGHSAEEGHSEREGREGEGSSGAGAAYDERGDRREASGEASGGSSTPGTGASADFLREGAGRGESGTRETEETETYEEGGRTRVRRRIVREEIIEEDA